VGTALQLGLPRYSANFNDYGRNLSRNFGTWKNQPALNNYSTDELLTDVRLIDRLLSLIYDQLAAANSSLVDQLLASRAFFSTTVHKFKLSLLELKNPNIGLTPRP
jgi:hypothetical protein